MNKVKPVWFYANQMKWHLSGLERASNMGLVSRSPMAIKTWTSLYWVIGRTEVRGWSIWVGWSCLFNVGQLLTLWLSLGTFGCVLAVALKLSWLRPSNGCQIWPGLGCGDLGRFRLRIDTFAMQAFYSDFFLCVAAGQAFGNILRKK